MISGGARKYSRTLVSLNREGTRLMDFRPGTVNNELISAPAVPSFVLSSSLQSLCFRRKGQNPRDKKEIVGNFKEGVFQACVQRGKKVSEGGN